MKNKDTNKIDQKTIQKIKKELTKRKKEILEELKDISNVENHKVKFPEYGDKADENAQEIDEYSTNLATDKVLESTLRDIEKSLQRIEDGTYGVCKYCKKDINKKRLLARPVASACIECKSKLQNMN